MVLKEKYEKRYDWARLAMLLTIAFTAGNMVVSVIDPNWTVAFSASLPEMLFSILIAVVTTDGPLYLVILCAAAVLLLLTAFVLCWIFSKRRPGWMVAFLVIFLVDTVAMITLMVIAFLSKGATPDLWNILLRAIFQAAVLYFIITGLVARKQRYKK